MVSQIMWDTFPDSSEFFELYQVFVTIKLQGTESTSSRLGDTARKWVTADETIFVGQVGPATLLIIGDDEPTVGIALDELFKALETPAP